VKGRVREREKVKEREMDWGWEMVKGKDCEQKHTQQ
jgi:hypothetical protein